MKTTQLEVSLRLLVRECSRDVEAAARLEPNDPKEIVSETLVEALHIATSTNLLMRSTEALQTFLQHCDEFKEREDWLV